MRPFAAILGAAFAAPVLAQSPIIDIPDPTLAPTCAGCAGAAAALRGGRLATQWNFSMRWIDSRSAAERWRWTLDRTITDRFSIGIERSGSDGGLWTVDDQPFTDFLRTSDADTLLMPRFTWFVTPAAGELPSVVFGMGSDRLSIPRGQAFFLTFSRSIPGTPVSPFVSAKYATFTNRLAVPFGANVQLAPGLTFQGINDGEYTHLLLTRQLGDLGLTLLAARSRNLGIQINYGF